MLDARHHQQLISVLLPSGIHEVHHQRYNSYESKECKYTHEDLLGDRFTYVAVHDAARSKSGMLMVGFLIDLGSLEQ
jgi:hypothetical protein